MLNHPYCVAVLVLILTLTLTFCVIFLHYLSNPGPKVDYMEVLDH